MNYQETTDWLFQQLPVYQRQGAAAMKKDLTNIRLLLESLGNPHEKLRCIHVGGTNGKGTTAHLLAAGLQANNRKVGLYTSPHYLDFRERIKINGTFVPEQYVVDFVEAMQPTISKVKPSFFELTVAMAFDYFASQRVDWAVIEVGLGGRLDSTNVIDPALSVITNISIDHTQFLGTTLPEIAYEKAGIIKKNRPVVIGETDPATEPVFRDKAISVNAPIYFADQLWEAKVTTATPGQTYLALKLPGLTTGSQLPEIGVEACGPHVALNVRTAYCSLQLIHEISSDYDLIFNQLSSGWSKLVDNTKFFGRWQQLETHPVVIVDSAHNEGGISDTMRHIRSLTAGSQQATNLHFVLGVVNDKDLAAVLPLFPENASYYFSQAQIQRALPADQLAAAAASFGLKGKVYSSVSAALEVAKATAGKDDLIYVGGSIFTAAEVLPPVSGLPQA